MIYDIKNVVEIENPYRTLYEAEVVFQNDLTTGPVPSATRTYYVRGRNLDWYFDSERNYEAVPVELAQLLCDHIEGRTFWGNYPEVVDGGL
jgi:hypothetical protein